MADWMPPPFLGPLHLKISFPTHFSLTGSWTTTQKLLIGWIEIDSFYPWVPGAQKKPGENFPPSWGFGDVYERRAGNDFAGTKCTKNMKRDGNSLAKHDNVILDVHPSSIIKNHFENEQLPLKFVEIDFVEFSFDRRYDVYIYIHYGIIYIYEIYSKCMIIFNESFQFQFMYHFKMYNWWGKFTGNLESLLRNPAEVKFKIPWFTSIFLV